MQSVEGLFPERAVLRDPVGGRAEWSGIEATVVNAPFTAPLQEPGLFEDLQVFRDRGQRDVEGFRELGDASFSEREAGEDRAARRIRERREGLIEGGRIVNH